MRMVLILNVGDEQAAMDGRSAVRLETFLAAYYTLRDADTELVLASPEGGYPLGLNSWRPGGFGGGAAALPIGPRCA